MATPETPAARQLALVRVTFKVAGRVRGVIPVPGWQADPPMKVTGSPMWIWEATVNPAAL